MAPIGFALTVALFIVSGALSYFHTKEVIEAARWVSHSHQVLTELEGVLSTLKDAETGQRGFLLTESDAYLKPYRQAIDQMPAQLQELKDLIAYLLSIDSTTTEVAIPTAFDGCPP